MLDCSGYRSRWHAEGVMSPWAVGIRVRRAASRYALHASGTLERMRAGTAYCVPAGTSGTRARYPSRAL